MTEKSNYIIPDRSLRLVEIIGPAGAGKSTISTLLSEADPRIHLASIPNIRLASDTPFFLRYGFSMMPSLFRSWNSDCGRPTYREFVWLTILKGWHSILQREKLKHDDVTILDQGPIYLIAELNMNGPQYLRNRIGRTARESLIANWATALDLVIWLDAENDYLVSRIRSREKWHAMKEESTQDIRKFLSSFRENYEIVLSQLSAGENGPDVIRFDTGHDGPLEIVNNVMLKLGLVPQ